ncbi:alpha/beta hydrolase family esterase [Methylocapsa palsarum]|uniref:Polyhydroxybutyrate depolymerase n=1 Tax=Methylocapsa palsarum TaxID=1612308 RepID=A0A1I4C7C1_9HYPH|nr:alpha/beta fold hydrolase [Methylocapsa palsarum]SFK76011.1 polyhydroxybutyrate depolymerase [Methylocapsa palsarum]
MAGLCEMAVGRSVGTSLGRLVLRSVMAAGLAVLAIAGASATAFAAAGRVTIESGGSARTALLVQHRRLKQARRPVVVVLRGGRDKASHQRRIFGLEDMARGSGPILVYPDPQGHWAESPGPEMNRDTGFVRDLIGKLVSDGLADRRKVFLIGISSGGALALRLACENSALFAGVAVVISSMPADLGATCAPSRPLPFLIIAGTADTQVPFTGGKANLPDNKSEFLAVDATLGIFGKAAGCGEGRTSMAFPDRNPRDGSRAYLDKLTGCKVPVALVRIEGGGHSIPGHWNPGDPESGPAARNNDIESAKLIWDFFREAQE